VTFAMLPVFRVLQGIGGGGLAGDSSERSEPRLHRHALPKAERILGVALSLSSRDEGSAVGASGQVTRTSPIRINPKAQAS
jgi:hypothetical protein